MVDYITMFFVFTCTIPADITASLATMGLAVSPTAPSLDNWGLSDAILFAEHYKHNREKHTGLIYLQKAMSLSSLPLYRKAETGGRTAAVKSPVAVNRFACHSTTSLTSSTFEPRPFSAVPVQSVCTQGEQLLNNQYMNKPQLLAL